jgi:hypothetical protein
MLLCNADKDGVVILAVVVELRCVRGVDVEGGDVYEGLSSEFNVCAVSRWYS